ncbi:efflux transporter outer membrane subunit (plasmid) [Ralstonia syzygii subsp. celebesensis]|uniref:Multidrug transporter n=2 Tax=Ralstonia syzygii subsp. celebesensis TaxID=1310168 RepID=A0A1U9VN88_9RALS|nr:multidrug transporter [blood disease bacterium A2-HR MARDI]QQV58405.1 efflux transporter outer membrane subunit [Ralstonia syzygii subsp. celebesensis]CCA83860.1 putative multidrug efflux MFS outer membrane protein [blood disease bacterium R229]
MNRAFGSWDLRRAAYGAPALALALAGCITAPDLRGPALASPEAALRSRAAVVAGEPALTEAAVPSQWWELFGDATLIGLEAEAAESNLDLQGAAARIEESRARLGLADAARQPQLAADAGYARSAISAHSPLARLGAPTQHADTWLLGLEAGWELDLWGRLRHLSESAEANLEASGYGKEAVRVSIAAEVAYTYLQLRGVQAQDTVAEQNRQIAQGLVRMAESRERNGVATRFDAAAARADVAGIEARLSQLHHKRDALMNALALLLGKPPRELDSRLATAGLPAMPKRLPVGIPSELARQRPDILQADARLRATVADIGAAEADFYPRISLTGSAGVQAFDFSDLGSWASRRYAFGPTLHLPIFEGGRLKNTLALSEARQRLAAIAYQQTVLRAWHEVDDALGAYASELKRHEQLQRALTQNQTALDVAQRAYQQGTADFTSVLVARRSLLTSHAELIDCATASALSVVALYRALGGGWSSQLWAETAPAGSAS